VIQELDEFNKIIRISYKRKISMDYTESQRMNNKLMLKNQKNIINNFQETEPYSHLMIVNY